MNVGVRYFLACFPLYRGKILRCPTQNLSHKYGSVFSNSVILSSPLTGVSAVVPLHAHLSEPLHLNEASILAKMHVTHLGASAPLDPPALDPTLLFWNAFLAA